MSAKHPSQISILDFTYDLPQEKIATYPLAERDQSKLLIYKNGEIRESVFKNISEELAAGTLLVFNKTKVIRARLNFENSKGQAIELFCLEPNEANAELTLAMAAQGKVRWNCLVGNLRQWKEQTITLSKNEITLSAEIIEKQSQQVVIEFSWTPEKLNFSEVIEQLGNTPIPPYLNRKSERLDEDRYQTIYAEKEGSVAAPTAGLHFTEAVMRQLKEKNLSFLSLTLHVSAGTFKPVKAETMAGHDMHAEWIDVSREELVSLIEHQGPLIPVGTTSMRTLESLYWMGVKLSLNPNLSLKELEIKQWEAYELEQEAIDPKKSLKALYQWMVETNHQHLVCHTAILIAPPYKLKLCDGIITNFHQPQSTLLLLVSSVVGDRWRDIYVYALNHQFRFLSYGDSSLLFK